MTSDAVRSASVAVMGRHYPAVAARRRAGRQSLWCMMSARAVNPDRSKKFFAAWAPGSAYASIPMQPASEQNSTIESAIDSPTPTARCLGFDVEVADHAQASAVAQRLELDGSEPDDAAVDRAHHDRGVVAVEQRARALPRAAPDVIRASPRAGRRVACAICRGGRARAGRARAGRTGQPRGQAPLRELPGELFDLAENGAALPVRRLVGVDGVELRGRQADEALHHLRCGQCVVPGDRQRRHARARPVALRLAAAPARRHGACRFRRRGGRRRRRGRGRGRREGAVLGAAAGCSMSKTYESRRKGSTYC